MATAIAYDAARAAVEDARHAALINQFPQDPRRAGAYADGTQPDPAMAQIDTNISTSSDDFIANRNGMLALIESA
jgi:hypothetical protein